MSAYGYAGKILRVDLSNGRIGAEHLSEATCRNWVGGVGLGAKYLYDEVPPGVEWSDPQNRLIWTTGPLAGSRISGAANFNVTTKGPMTNLAGSSQANGFFGAYLKFSGFDGVVFEGAAPHLVYLWIHDGTAEIKDARHLTGADVQEMEQAIREELGTKERDVSIFGVGPAAEHRVLYSVIAGDGGHVASKNGMGTVMASKNLKAVVAHKGTLRPSWPIWDAAALTRACDDMWAFVQRESRSLLEWGTGGGFSQLHDQGELPVRNYTTNDYPQHGHMNGQYLRTHFKIRSKPCFRCRLAHVKEVTVTEGPYVGLVAEEPEYEMLAAWGPQIGNTDLGAVVMLTNEVDRLGLDGNEAGWVVGWTMECFEKGVFGHEETGGLDLRWGNVEAARELLNRIATREGYLGNLLADGVRRAAWRVGGEASGWAVYAGKGATPRGHDHRGRWSELFDTCMSNTSTLESSWGGYRPEWVDLPPADSRFSHEAVSTLNASFNGIRLIDDCLGLCRFVAPHPKMQIACLNAVTGWNWSLDDAFTVGRRIVNLLRAFNLRHGLNVEEERPSTRYGSVPVDGPNRGEDIMAKWSWMVRNYRRLMGWDESTGKPLPETLRKLGLEETIRHLGEDSLPEGGL